MASELSYVLITPYSLRKSRTGGIITRLLFRTGLELAGAQIITPDYETCAAFADSGAAYLVPKDATSACKRVCLFLRWMARSGSPVDIGLWSDFIDRRTLIMPLDTHVLDEARRLGLISGKQTSMRTAIKLTAEMATAFPDDPLKGDFALFGHGLETARMRSSAQD